MTEKTQEVLSKEAAEAEALLFTQGSPMSLSKLAKVLGCDGEKLNEVLQELSEHYRKFNHGLNLFIGDRKIQLTTAPHCAQVVRRMISGDLDEELSTAALEVLAIVAYRGPVSKAQIDAIRGVNCAFSLRNLQMRGLISRKVSDVDARAYLYEVTEDFLTHLGISSVEELPDYDSLKDNEKIKTVLLNEKVEN